MALGVDDMRARRVVVKATLLTVGTLGFVVCLTLMYLSMRSVMDVGGSCASGGPYTISRPCPQGVAWVMPLAIFGGLFFVGMTFLGVFEEGGPRPYAFAWSALFIALGWNFIDYGVDPPGGGTSVSWLVCGAIFFVMGGAPLVFLLSKSGARWAFWGPVEGEKRPMRSIRRAQPVPPGDSVFVPRAGGGLVPATASTPAPAPVTVRRPRTWSSGSSASPSCTNAARSTTTSTRSRRTRSCTTRPDRDDADTCRAPRAAGGRDRSRDLVGHDGVGRRLVRAVS
jgi:hypothetical protein